MNILEIAGEDQPARKSAQRLRWFFRSFEKQSARVTAETGVVYSIDEAVLAEVFADWLKLFKAQKPNAAEDRLAYVSFAAGLMLQTMIEKTPVSVASKPEHANLSKPAFFWPEGYLYVAYCLNVRSLVIEQDFQIENCPNETLDNTRTWWSFKENVEEDPALAVAFLELFAGEEPDWKMPGLFRPTHLHEISGRLHHREPIKPLA